MERFDVDVVVVGAGAAGLAAAAALGSYGVPTLLIEQRREPSRWPRATVVSTRTMELLRAWGLEQEMLAGGVDADVQIWECATLARAAEGTAHAVGYPSRDQAAVVSPCAPGTVPQDWLEAVVRRHVKSARSVRFEVGTELVDLDNADHGVSVTVRDVAGGLRTFRSRYLVAADGAHSPVRRLLGIAMHDRDGTHRGVQVVFHAPLWPLLGDRRYALYVVTTPEAPGLFLPAGHPDRWLYGPSLPPEAEQLAPVDQAHDLDPARLVHAIRVGAGVAFLEPRIARIGAFHSPGQLATKFRAGRAFLVGDAAHRVTPRGGTGMNTAFQSGYDVGWKLAWVLQGWAEPELLDTYEAERRVVAEHNVARSTDPDGSRRPVLDELNVDLGGRLAHAWLPSTSGRVSTLDLLGPGWTLFTGPDRQPWEAMASLSRTPVTVRTVDPLTARHVGVRGDGALLARPDGVPVAIWSSSAGASGLRRAMDHLTSPLAPDLAVA